MGERFLLGVIEGFYGKPWTFEQRKRLFVREKEFDFKYFMYAPKDEAKHRRLWRELHDEIELLYLKELILGSIEQEIYFVYAISPGLDMVYSSEQELNLLEAKLKQVYDLGCRHFALLFDDIDPQFSCSLDQKRFPSLAKAQVHVSNHIYKSFSSDCYFMFCPTEYCASRAYPTLEDSNYLLTIGNELCQAFDVLWTGEKVVPEAITAQHIKSVRKLLKRKPLIWENLHANDYDPRRVFLGPYFGRDLEIVDEIAGVLSNPNNQFELNYIPLLSLSLWYQCAVQKQEYDIKKVCRTCIEKWTTEISRQLPCEERILTQITQAAANPTSSTQDNSSNGGCSNTQEMDFSVDSTYSISLDEVELIVSFNFLPYGAGPAADSLFEEAKWLVENSSCKTDDWSERGYKLIDEAGKVMAAIDNMLDCPNKQIAFEIYPMLSETRVIMDMLTRHFNWLLGESCPLSEEKRVGFYTRFGINGQFNTLLSSILEPNSWFGGVMVLPLAERFVPKAAKFVCSMIDYHDSAVIESLLVSAMEQSPVLCYVIMNSQDDILAISIGYEDSTNLVKFIENKFIVRSSVTSASDETTNSNPAALAVNDDDEMGGDNGVVEMKSSLGSSVRSDNSPIDVEGDTVSVTETLKGACIPVSAAGAAVSCIPSFINYLLILLRSANSASSASNFISSEDTCSVIVIHSPKILPKMIENFLLCINTAIKTLLNVKASRLIFDKAGLYLGVGVGGLQAQGGGGAEIDDCLVNGLKYTKDEHLSERFTLYAIKHREQSPQTQAASEPTISQTNLVGEEAGTTTMQIQENTGAHTTLTGNNNQTDEDEIME